MLGSGLRHTPEELPSAHWEPARPKVVSHVEHPPLPPSFLSGKTVSKTGLGGAGSRWQPRRAASPAPYAAPSPLAAAGGSCESAGAGKGASASATVAADAAASGLL